MNKQRKARKATVRRSVSHVPARLKTWKLEDAKARFSEVVRLAGTSGPQMVTVRGKEAAVVLSPAEFELLCPSQETRPLLDFLRDLQLSEIPLVREPDAGRDTRL